MASSTPTTSIPDPPASIPNEPRSITDFTFPPAPILTLPRCHIRVMHPLDAPSMVHEANNPAVAKFMTNAFSSPYTLPAAYRWILINVSAPIQYNFVLTVPGDAVFSNSAPEPGAPHAVIGGIGLKPGADLNARKAEIGYWIGEAHWGKGILAEALRAFTEWTWSAFPELVRLEGVVLAGNSASCRVLEKAGYIRESVARWRVASRDGVVMDEVVYRLCRDEWEEAQRSGRVEERRREDKAV